MKKLLIGIAICFSVSLVAQSQPYKDFSQKTITAADTITLSTVRDGVCGIQATYLETSGTSAGKFYIQGSIDDKGWQHIDSSKSLSDVATYQTVILAATATSYSSYRLICSNTSSATGTLYFTLLRRREDRR